MPAVDKHQLHEQREALGEACIARFGVALVLQPTLLPPCHDFRADATTHTLLGMDVKLTDELRRQVRHWLERERGLQFSRQIQKPFRGAPDVDYVFIAEMLPVPLDIGYHATRRANLALIWQQGLLPSSPCRQNTDRHDCEGNIYVCNRLGTPDDAGVTGSKSAYFWRDHLAKKSTRFPDPDWVIVEVDLRALPGALTIRDMWSESGIVVCGVDSIPSDRLRLVFEDEIAVRWDAAPVPLDQIYRGLSPEEDLERRFSRLRRGAYAILELPETGASARYNCKAYAAGFRDKYLMPRKSVEAEAQFFATCLGYRPHAAAAPEPGFEKIALYAKGDRSVHVARQSPSGRWVSKIGAYELIEHELDDLAGEGEYEYGEVRLIMARPVTAAASAAMPQAAHSPRDGPCLPASH
jgi:hypothetical protein